MKSIFYTILLSLSAFGCEKDQSFPVSFEFQLLDNDNNPTTIFKEGEEIIFSFLINNPSNENIAWYNYCNIYSEVDLYKVYKLAIDENKNENYTLAGQPFSAPVNCEDKPILISPRSNYYLKIPWSFNQSNGMLNAGKYKVEFEAQIKFNDKIIQKFFSQNFIIE